MKERLITLGLLLISIFALSQNISSFNLNGANNLEINPATAGYNHSRILFFSHDKDFSSFENSPSTNSLSFHLRASRKNHFDHTGEKLRLRSFLKSGFVGFGVNFYDEQSGAVKRSAGNFSIAYHPFINDKKNQLLSIGISANISQISIRAMYLGEDYFEYDPLLTGTEESDIISDLNFGLLFSSPKNYTGISIHNLLQQDIKLVDNSETSFKNNRIIYFYGGMYFDQSNGITIEPSIFFRHIISSPETLSAKTTIHFKEKLRLSLGYGINKNWLADFSFTISHFIFKYSYGDSSDNIFAYSNGSHEIKVGYIFKQPKRHPSGSIR